MELAAQIFNAFPELCILTLVIVIDVLLPCPTQLSPATYAKQLAAIIGRKMVVKAGPNAQLYGWLSLATYLFITLTLCFSVLFIAKLDLWTEGLLLYLSLGYHQAANRLKGIDPYATSQKSLTRSVLKPFTEFEVDKLTPLGLQKLSLEILTDRFVSYWLVPIVLFLTFGGVVAFVYRLIVEANNAWLTAKPSYFRFGRGVFVLKTYIEIIPAMLLAPIYSVFTSSPGWFVLLREQQAHWRQNAFSNLYSLIWLSITAAGCKCEIAGPVMLEQQKVSRPRINQGQKGSTDSIKTLLTWNRRFLLTVVIFNLVTVFAIFFYT